LIAQIFAVYILSLKLSESSRYIETTPFQIDF
jgi:hypothetical protein